MKTLFIIVAAILSFSILGSDNVYREAKNPICSYAGLRVIFLNGVFNEELDAIKSRDRIEYFIKGNDPTSRQQILDENKVVFSHLYNPTNGLFSDSIEFLKQKVRELSERDVELAVIKDDIIGKLDVQIEKTLAMGGNVDAYVAKKKMLVETHINNAKLKEIPDNSVTASLASSLKGYIDAREKVLIVSHSQGNMFANEIYLKLIDSYPELKSTLDNYLAVLYVASPASFRRIPKNDFVKIEQDYVTGWLGEEPNFKAVSGTWDADFFNHGFLETYLSSKVNVSYEGNNKPLKEVFLNKLVKLAREFPANCCRASGSSATMPDRNPFGKVLKDGGWISSTALERSSIDPSSYYGVGVEICDGAAISGRNHYFEGNVSVQGSATIRGDNIDLYDAIQVTYDLDDLGIIQSYVSDGVVRVKDLASINGSFMNFENESGDASRPVIIDSNASFEGCYISVDSRQPEHSDTYADYSHIGSGAIIRGSQHFINSDIANSTFSGGHSSVFGCTQAEFDAQAYGADFNGAEYSKVTDSTFDNSRAVSSLVSSNTSFKSHSNTEFCTVKSVQSSNSFCLRSTISGLTMNSSVIQYLQNFTDTITNMSCTQINLDETGEMCIEIKP